MRLSLDICNSMGKQFNPSKIYVCDSAGGQKPGITEKAMKESGIYDVCKDEGVECVPFEKTERLIYYEMINYQCD